MKKGLTRAKTYSGENLNFPAFPLGGIGAGMICLEGTGTLSHFSLRNKPDVFNEPTVFSALTLKGENNISLVLAGSVQARKIFGNPGSGGGRYSNNKSIGLPRFDDCSFSAKFPFGTVKLEDKLMPLEIDLTGWSPFIPNDADNSSLPCAALEYSFRNNSNKELELVYSFNSFNFMGMGDEKNYVRKTNSGFVLVQEASPEKPWEEGYFCARIRGAKAKVNPAWFRGGWADPLTAAWKDICGGKCPDKKEFEKSDAPSPGASIYVPFKLKKGEIKTVTVLLSWFVPETNIRQGKDIDGTCSCFGKSLCEQDKKETYKPWYSGKFKDVGVVSDYWLKNYNTLKEKTLKFSECLYGMDFPEELVEAVTANLTILKSPTVLRQTDGRLWCWEGCCDENGCCPGSCTHVWNYAQVFAHLFPELEKSLRQTEFNECQDEKGHQRFRASLPIRTAAHDNHAAADGQLGGIMKVYREWRISGDRRWLKSYWPKVRQSLDYCIETWDPEHKGVLSEPHHNTYDIEFWGPDGMCSSFYLGALKAAFLMAEALEEEASLYKELFGKGRNYLEEKLFNGEYFEQKIQWKGLRAGNPVEAPSQIKGKYSPEAIKILKKEGPKYQYGKGCLSDGILGAWMAEVCGIGEILDGKKVKSHLLSVYKYNLKKDLSKHVNPQRYTYAIGKEGGLLTCSWPKGGRLTIPFPYSEEVFTGVEYQVASHLIMTGCMREGLEIVKTCRRRYDGKVRNPFNEYECGHWYGRALASYALIQALSGIRYDAVDKVLYVNPTLKSDFRSFICTATGYGTVGIKRGKPFIKIVEGSIEFNKIMFK